MYTDLFPNTKNNKSNFVWIIFLLIEIKTIKVFSSSYVIFSGKRKRQRQSQKFRTFSRIFFLSLYNICTIAFMLQKIILTISSMI